ncbi:MAG: hypothetical protein U0172_00900 [Nitrospiraceae bacterium]
MHLPSTPRRLRIRSLSRTWLHSRTPTASRSCSTLCALAVLMLSGCAQESQSSPPATDNTSPTKTVSTPALPTAKLIFKSNFGSGVSLGVPRDYYPNGAWQDLLGTDSETGYSWPMTALGTYFSGVQLITVDPITPTTLNNYISNEIRTVPGPTGSPVRELFQNVKIKAPAGDGGSQAPLMLQRTWNSDVPDLYIAYWFKHQADLPTSLVHTSAPGSSGHWRVQFEFKTGGAVHPLTGLRYGGGDYRIITSIMKHTDGHLYWASRGDNNANRVALDSSGAVIPCPDTTYCPKLTFWSEENHVVPVPVDRWFRYETYWHRSNGADGRYWVAVDGHVLVDHYGPNMGVDHLPITRIMVNNAYSGGNPEVQSQTTGFEIWDGFPCGEGVPCYRP